MYLCYETKRALERCKTSGGFSAYDTVYAHGSREHVKVNSHHRRRYVRPTLLSSESCCCPLMSPIRRYLRITKYSVLEVRIYLDKPSDAPWLLSSRDPVLPRIIEEVRPKVLPKLREENENAKRKGSKKNRGIKDVVSQGM